MCEFKKKKMSAMYDQIFVEGVVSVGVKVGRAR